MKKEQWKITRDEYFKINSEFINNDEEREFLDCLDKRTLVNSVLGSTGWNKFIEKVVFGEGKTSTQKICYLKSIYNIMDEIHKEEYE